MGSRCTVAEVPRESDERYGFAAPDMAAWQRSEPDMAVWQRFEPDMAVQLRQVCPVDSDSRSIRWAGCFQRKCPPVPTDSA